MFKHWSQAGFTLTEVLISGSILAGLSVGAMQLFKKQADSTKYSAQRAELDNFHNRLTKIFSDYRNCNANFHSAMGTPSVTAASLSSSSTLVQCCPNVGSNTNCVLEINDCGNTSPPYNYASSVKRIATTGAQGDHAKGFVPKSFLVEESPGTSAISGTGNVTKKGVLKITYALPAGSNASGPREVVKSIPLTLKFTNSNFYSCIDSELGTKNTLNQEMCLALDPDLVEFDQETDRCVFKDTISTHTCPGNQVLLGLNADGTKNCVNAEDVFDMGQMVDPTFATTCDETDDVSFTLDPVTNKIKFKCGDASPPPTTGGTTGCTPTNRVWSSWYPWGACVNGSQTRVRVCTGVVTCGGQDLCTGSPTETQSCTAPPCTPATTCAALKSTRCPNETVSDSCGTPCGNGTFNNCCNFITCPVGKTKILANVVDLFMNYCVNASAGCVQTSGNQSTCKVGNNSPYVACANGAPSPGFYSCSSQTMGTYYTNTPSGCNYP